MLKKTALHQRRSEYGKLVRKDYEAHRLNQGRCKMQEYVPRTDEKCGTLSTVEKDNYVMIYEENNSCKQR